MRRGVVEVEALGVPAGLERLDRGFLREYLRARQRYATLLALVLAVSAAPLFLLHWSASLAALLGSAYAWRKRERWRRAYWALLGSQ